MSSQRDKDDLRLGLCKILVKDFLGYSIYNYSPKNTQNIATKKIYRNSKEIILPHV